MWLLIAEIVFVSLEIKMMMWILFVKVISLVLFFCFCEVCVVKYEKILLLLFWLYLEFIGCLLINCYKKEKNSVYGKWKMIKLYKCVLFF